MKGVYCKKIMENRIGEKVTTNEGYEAKILNYRKATDIDIIYEDGYIAYNKTYAQFKKGSVSKYGNFKNRTGEKAYNKQGYLMEIIRYKNARECDVLFDDGSIRYNIPYRYFNERSLENLNHKTVYNKGYIGYGKYKPKNKTSGKFIPQYVKWYSMMNRCYSEKSLSKEPTYRDCIICEEWHNFQNFAKWYDDNYYELEDETMCLDKDILIKGNKIYSPNTCVFAPIKINSIFVKKPKRKLPTGIVKHHKKYIVYCGTNKNNHNYLGVFQTIKEAFEAYKTSKESYIKEVADEYKNKYPNFPQNLYNAMYNYEVEITD